MSESNLGSRLDKLNSEQNGEEKRRRRTRNDDDGRNFSCSCGKSYLSYPALYTHIKTKHNGKAEYSRGATLREDNSEEEREEEQVQQEVEKGEDVNNMDGLRKYLTRFFPFSPKDREGDRRLCEMGKDDQMYIKSIKEYWQKHRKEDELQLNEAYATYIDFVLGRFLLDIEGQVSKSCIKFLQQFVINMRNGLNELQVSDKFCKSNCAANLPLMMNSLFTDVFQKMDKGHLYMKHPTIPCKVLFHFSRWLFQQKFTNQSLKFNTL